jgi:iron complex outermembrane receptor protein
MAGGLPDLFVKRVDHSTDIAQAVRRILTGSRLRAVQVDATTWRIEAIPAKRPREPAAR